MNQGYEQGQRSVEILRSQGVWAVDPGQIDVMSASRDSINLEGKSDNRPQSTYVQAVRKIRRLRRVDVDANGETTQTVRDIVVDHDFLDSWIDNSQRRIRELEYQLLLYSNAYRSLSTRPTGAALRGAFGLVRRIMFVLFPRIMDQVYREVSPPVPKDRLSPGSRTRPDKLE